MKTIALLIVTALVSFHLGFMQGLPNHQQHHVRIVAKKTHHHIRWVAFLKGKASWYGCDAKLHAEKECPWGMDHTQGHYVSAYPKRFNTYYPMCASWHFKLGTWVYVENVKTHKATACVIWDRGPNVSLHRTIDLSHYVKKAIGMKGGMGTVIVYRAAS